MDQPNTQAPTANDVPSEPGIWSPTAAAYNIAGAFFSPSSPHHLLLKDLVQNAIERDREERAVPRATGRVHGLDRELAASVADELDLDDAKRQTLIRSVAQIIADEREGAINHDLAYDRKEAEGNGYTEGWNAALEAVQADLRLIELDTSGWDGEVAELLGQMIEEQAMADGILRSIDLICGVCAAHVVRPADHDCPAAALWAELTRVQATEEGNDA